MASGANSCVSSVRPLMALANNAKRERFSNKCGTRSPMMMMMMMIVMMMMIAHDDDDDRADDDGATLAASWLAKLSLSIDARPLIFSLSRREDCQGRMSTSRMHGQRTRRPFTFCSGFYGAFASIHRKPSRTREKRKR